MSTSSHAGLKPGAILVATDFSPASQMAMAYAMSYARRHRARLYITHVVNSQSERAVMDGWRSGQAEITNHFVAGHLDGIEHELVVKAGEVWPVLSQMIAEHGIDLVVTGTRGRTGVTKMLLGSVAEGIFRHCPCPVLTVGPGLSGQDPQQVPQRILAPTGFAPQSVLAVRHALWMAEELGAILGVLHVVAGGEETGPGEQAKVRKEREERLRALIPATPRLGTPPVFFVEFGATIERILQTAADWGANLIVLGLRQADERRQKENLWVRAYEVVRQASCPVMTIRLPG